MGALQLAFALVCLAPFFARSGSSQNDTTTIFVIAKAVWLEFLFALLMLGVFCVIWGIAAPRSLERLFSKALNHLWVVLLVICICLLATLAYVLAAGL